MPKIKLDLDTLQVESCAVTHSVTIVGEATHTDFFSFPCCPASGDVNR